MKQTILFLDQQSWRGGGQRVLEEVLAALDRSQFDPIVAFPEDGVFAVSLRARGIETMTYPLGSYRAGPKSAGEMVAFAARTVCCGFMLARTIVRRNVALVYINGPRCLPAGALAARLTRKPSVFHLHLALNQRLALRVTARAARNITRILACCRAGAEALLGVDPRLHRTTEVLYNPISSPPPRGPGRGLDFLPDGSGRNRDMPIIGMVGRITPQKGQDVLLRALTLLSSRRINFKVIIVGAPAPDRPEDAAYFRLLQNTARESGLDDKICWVGYQATLDDYYACFDVLVVPSTYSEGLPLVALEAMRFGVPVIASPICGIPEIVREEVNGILVQPGDEMALAQGLERVLTDEALRAQLRVGARSTIDERFLPENFKRKIRSVIAELCAAPKIETAKDKAEVKETSLELNPRL